MSTNIFNLIKLYKILNSVQKNSELFYILSRYKSTTWSNINHYQILNLKRNCTSKDIRIAFLMLTKIYHPDVKKSIKDPNATAKFIRIQEAYKVLQNKSSRAAYDNQLFNNQNPIEYNMYTYNNYDVGEKYTDFDGKFNSSYYGVNGIKKVSNGTILWVLILFTALCTLLEFFLVRNSITTNRTNLDKLSIAANSVHEGVRSKAMEYGNEKQLEKITKRLLREV